MWLNQKRKSKKGLTGARWQRPWERLREKRQKNGCRIWTSRRERERAFWKVLNSEKHVETHEKKKKLSKQFLIDRKTSLINRKLHSIDQVSIEHRSSQADSNQNFNHNFDRLSNKFDQSKIWKNQIFEN